MMTHFRLISVQGLYICIFVVFVCRMDLYRRQDYCANFVWSLVKSIQGSEFGHGRNLFFLFASCMSGGDECHYDMDHALCFVFI